MKRLLAVLALAVLTGMMPAPAISEDSAPELSEEQQKREEDMAKRREAAEEDFRNRFDFQSRLFRLKNLSAETALTLISTELKTYSLVQTSAPGNPFKVAVSTGNVQQADPGGRVIATAEERVVADAAMNSVIVIATPETLERVGATLKEWDSTIPRRDAEAPVVQHRIEIILLRGGKVGEPGEIPGDAIRLSFAAEGMIDSILVKPGARVKEGQSLAQLDMSEAQLSLREVRSVMESARAQYAAAEAKLARAKEMAKAATISQDELANSERELAQARARIEQSEIAMERAENKLRAHVLEAPEPGVVAAVMANPHERVAPGNPVMTLIPDAAATATTQTAKVDPAAQYGISGDDLKLFGLGNLSELGKAVVSIAGQKDEIGRAAVSLADGYRLELEFIDARPPYLVLRARLSSRPQGQPAAGEPERPLLENTLFLESGKPTLLGLTNLRQALILVVRLAGPKADKETIEKAVRNVPLQPAARR